MAHYLYTLQNPINFADPFGLKEMECGCPGQEAALPSSWHQLYEDVQDKSKTPVDAFVYFVETSGAINNFGILAGGFLPESTLGGFGARYARFVGLIPEPSGFGPKGSAGGGYGSVFRHFQDLAKANALPQLGFSEGLKANEYWNFAHFAGLSSAYQFGKFDTIISQIEEDLRQLETAKKSKPGEIPERCAEIAIDLIALQYVMGMSEAKAAAFPKGQGRANVCELREKQRKNVQDFLKKYNLKEELTKRKRDCDADKAALEKLLRTFKEMK